MPTEATALHLAAGGDHLEYMVSLLEAGAPVDAAQSQPAGVTPLMLAVRIRRRPLACGCWCARADPQRTPQGQHAAQHCQGDGNDGSARLAAGRRRKRWARHWQEPRTWLGGPALGCALACARAPAQPPLLLQFAIADADGGVAEPATGAPLVVELWADVVPKTAENFRCLCTGEKGACAAFGSPPLHYKGNAAHRIVPYQILQAGDITTGDGKGGESIYGRKFADESFDGRAGRHSSKGLLSMANSGRNSNGSQFFLCTVATPHLDGKHVAFGRVVEGMEYIEALSGAAGDNGGKPRRQVVIADCGDAHHVAMAATAAAVAAALERLRGHL